MWRAVSEQQDKLVEALNNISLDIREIKTSLRHFEDRFNEKLDQVEKEASGIKIQVSENEHEVERLKLKFVREEEKTKEHDASISRIFKEIEDNKREVKADRKWLIGTIIGVVTTLIGFGFKLFGM